jgi:hypothetical protein
MQQKLHSLRRQLNAFAKYKQKEIENFTHALSSLGAKKQRGYQSFSERSYARSIVLEAGWVGSYGAAVLCWNRS